jgi:energy-converting hydrogenase B subunit D
MTVLQVTTLTAVMVMGVAVVLTRDLIRQVIVNGVFGLTLVLLFVVLQAPDVGLSELVAGTVAFPVVLLATIARIRVRENPE